MAMAENRGRRTRNIVSVGPPGGRRDQPPNSRRFCRASRIGLRPKRSPNRREMKAPNERHHRQRRKIAYATGAHRRRKRLGQSTTAWNTRMRNRRVRKRPARKRKSGETTLLFSCCKVNSMSGLATLESWESEAVSVESFEVWQVRVAPMPDQLKQRGSSSELP